MSHAALLAHEEKTNRLRMSGLFCGARCLPRPAHVQTKKKKIVRIIHQSAGPLPLRFAGQFAGCLLVFSDASLKRQGGLAAVIFDDPESAPLVRTRSVPITGSNELELLAALFGLEQARRQFPGRTIVLFSDNQDAVVRLNRAQTLGPAQDPALLALTAERGIVDTLAEATVCWIKGHSSCRGNTLADEHAAAAAS